MKHLILGGTGTLGQAITKELLKEQDNQVLCLSRCELKQKTLAAELKDDRVKFVLGDIRNPDLLRDVMSWPNVVYHVAALKHIDVLEENPEESIRTNVLGTMNVAEAAIRAGVPNVLFSSTDKAVDPVNVYGMCKGISEKILLRKNETQGKTRFAIYRWGNVLGSRGSAIHSFVNTLIKENTAYITHEDMTRFWIRIEDAVKFMLSTYRSTLARKSVLVPPIKAASVDRLIRTLANVLQLKDYKVVNVGMRRGEKLHELLWSQHSKAPMSSETADQYTDMELFYLLKDVLSENVLKGQA